MDCNSAVRSNIYYLFDEKLISECDRIPVVKLRASMVHSLIQSYGLLDHLKVLRSIKASAEDLKLFHSSDFVNYMKETNGIHPEDDVTEEQAEYGLCYDCPPVENMFEMMLTIAGGSLTAASALLADSTRATINWCGGWHHAQRDEAEGFCYVNDIVIAIEKLRQKYQRILYVDLDIHHGNGVENAYAYTKRVFTLSFHKYEAGFYPGTGSLHDVGLGNGKGYSCNVPLKEGVSDDALRYAFEHICPEVYSAYSPSAVVVQCGGDCINGDPLGESNLTPLGVGECVAHILSWHKPTMFLGGGGYNKANTARLWAYLTAIITGQKENISMDIPDHCYFLKYGPDYDLSVSKGCQKDHNTKEYLNEVIATVKENLKKYVLKET